MLSVHQLTNMSSVLLCSFDTDQHGMRSASRGNCQTSQLNGFSMALERLAGDGRYSGM
jgi:hypothetical protein